MKENRRNKWQMKSSWDHRRNEIGNFTRNEHSDKAHNELKNKNNQMGYLTPNIIEQVKHIHIHSNSTYTRFL